MAKYVFLNDGFINEGKAVLHFSDLSFQRGYGIFDFFRLIGNKPLFLDDHLDRFFSSAKNMHLPIPANRDEIKQLISELIEKNNLSDTGIRLSLTGGYSVDEFNIGLPNLLISQHSFPPPQQLQREKGIKLLPYSYQRQLPHIKTIDYLMAIWLQPLKSEKGADDILYHANGFISECPRSNFFLVTNGNCIVTPAENVLKGITRAKVIELAREHYSVEERPVHIEEIKTAREAFVTSTTKQILPVGQIGEKHFTEKRVSGELLNSFRNITMP
jgi:branched-chain amino acid aminotransferase